jgi:hypothetical protein
MITLGGEKVRPVQGPKDKHHELLAQEKYGELLTLRRQAQAVTAGAADLVEARDDLLLGRADEEGGDA